MKTHNQNKQQNYPTKPSVKFVKKANMWCRTTFEKGKQKIEWFSEEPQWQSKKE